MHVTCVAHLLHKCTTRVRAFFKNIDDIVATIKATTIKNRDRKNGFCEYRALATNFELVLEASDCTMTEAYKLLKNMYFLNEPCSIQAYIKKTTIQL